MSRSIVRPHGATSMKSMFIIPSLLIFLGGMATGFSLFPYLVPPKEMNLPIQSIVQENPPITPLAQAPMVMPPPLPSSPDQSVLQLFSPTSAELDSMQTDADQKKLLEQTLMISFLLSNCQLMNEKEYQQTYSTLVEYLRVSGAANSQLLVQEAAERAKASYQMLYSKVPCDDPSLRGMQQSLNQWRESALAGKATH